MVNHDRFGLFRPTANEDGEVIHPEWSTLRNVHLDVSSSLSECVGSSSCITLRYIPVCAKKILALKLMAHITQVY